MIKLPEPHKLFTERTGHHVYTESQMRQAIRDALEEALVICRTVYFDEYPDAETWERSTEHQCIEKLRESV